MKVFRKIIFLIVAFLLILNRFSLAQVTREKIISMLQTENDGGRQLIQTLNSMNSLDKEKGVAEIISLLNEYYASGKDDPRTPEHGNMVTLIVVLPSVANNATTVAALTKYIEKSSGEIRLKAAEALSHIPGPESTRFFEAQVARSFSFFPELPYHQPTDEKIIMKNRDESIVYVFCLEGLLKSDSAHAREVGKHYLNLYRDKYKSNADGRKAFLELQDQLKKDGVLFEMPSAPVAEQTTNGKVPPSTSLRIVTSQEQSSPVISSVERQKRVTVNLARSSPSFLVIGSISVLIITLIGIVAWRLCK